MWVIIRKITELRDLGEHMQNQNGWSNKEKDPMMIKILTNKEIIDEYGYSSGDH